MMEDDSSADDLLIDVDEEDFALTAEELEQAEEMLGSNTGVGIGTKMKSNTGEGLGANMKEQAKEMRVGGRWARRADITLDAPGCTMHRRSSLEFDPRSEWRP